MPAPPSMTGIKRCGCSLDETKGEHLSPYWQSKAWVEYDSSRWTVTLGRHQMESHSTHDRKKAYMQASEDCFDFFLYIQALKDSK